MRRSLSTFAAIGALLATVVGCRPWNSDRSSLATRPSTQPTIALTATTTSATRPVNVPASLREAETFLASDDLEGRGVGTAGLDRAADYIASRFQQSGLKPAPGMKGYFQSFEMTTGASIDPKTVLKSGDATLALGKDYTPLSFSAEKSFDGAAVFAGYGIASEKHHYDDYAGIDVKGKVVIAMRFEPHDSGGKSRFAEKGEGWSNEATLIAKAKAAADHGAAALLLVNPPTHHGDTDDLMPFSRQLLTHTVSIPVLQVQRAVVEPALRQAHQPDLKSLQAQIDDSAKPASHVLDGVKFAGQVKLERKIAKVKNVVASLPGGVNANEYVVVGAHYDHLGRGGPGALGPRGEIYNGADDNASGTSAVMELADRLAHDGTQPRSILFVAFTGEESGLVGSQYFVDHPVVPLKQMAAMLNLDMVGRMNNDTLYIGGAGTAENFEQLMKDADAGLPVKLKEIGKGGIAPSDHMSFALKKVPVLFFFTGMHMDYHRPTDDVDKINFPGMEEVIDLGERVILALSRMSRQHYVDAADASSSSAMMGTGPGSRVRLGVIPDYGSDLTTGGVRITGAMPKSPAAAAGLQSGDVIVQFGEKKIDNLYDLSDALANAKPGDQVKIAVMRDGKRVEMTTTLAARTSEGAG